MDGDSRFEFQAAVVTRRLVLRPGAPRDRAAMQALLAEREVFENLAAWPASPSEGRSFVLAERDGGAIVGGAGLLGVAGRPGSVEVVAWLAPVARGRGYATEAAHAAVDLAFADPAVLRVWCSNRVTNQRARRVIEKCGFQFREAGMVRMPLAGGAAPVERFVLERTTWTSLKAWGAGTMEDRDDRRNDAA